MNENNIYQEPDWLREPQAAAQTLPPARRRTTVSPVNVPDPAVSAGQAADGRVRRDPPDQARLGHIADEQAALRRVATLVARGAAPEEVFTAVAEEVGQLLRVELATLFRYEPGRTATSVTTWGPAGENLPLASGGPLRGTTSPRSCSRPAARRGSTAMAIVPRARSVPPSERRASARRSGRRSSSREVCGGRFLSGRPWSSPCRRTPRHGWPPSPSWWRRRSRTPRAARPWPGWPRSRRRCGGSRRWWPAGWRQRRYSRRLRRRSGGCFPSIGRAWSATSPMPRPPSSPLGAGQASSFP